MSDNFDSSENQKPGANNPQENKSSSTANSSRRLKISRFKPNWDLPKINLPKFWSDKPKKLREKGGIPWLCLIIIAISYTFIGYFLSVLLTIPSRTNLAIASIVFVVLLPTISAFADYALMKWGYLISGFLIAGGLFFLARVKFYFVFLAIMLWLGTTMIAFVGENLLKQKRKFFVAIGILTIPCLIGLAAGWQLWQIAKKLS